MTVFSIPSFQIIRSPFIKGMFFALLGLFTLDGSLGITSAFAGFTVSPTTLAYTATVGQADKSGSVTVKNTGTTAITVTWADSLNFLYGITPGLSQTISAGLSGTFTLKARNSTFAAGYYSGTATISGGGVTTKVPVTLTISSTTTAPVIGLNTTSLGFTGTVGGTNPSAQTIGISNTGGGTLTWNVGDNAGWLTLSPLSGTNSGTVTASVSLSGLSAGSYSGTVTVTATNATAKTIPVSLNVASSTSTTSTGFSISPTTLAFTATVGQADKSGSVTVKNNKTTAMTVTWADSISFLYGITPGLSQTISAGQSGTFTLKAKNSTLAAGSYSGTATISGGGVTTKVPVTLTIKTATSSNQATLVWGANTALDLAGYKVYQRSSSATYGAPIATIPKSTTSYTTGVLQTGTTYYFVITAYDTSGNESLRSTEVSKSVY